MPVNPQKLSIKGLLIPSGALLVCLAFIFVAMTPLFIVPLLGVLIISVAFIIYWFNWQVPFIKILVFLLPFSVELPVAEGTLLRIPGEPLIAIAGVVFAFMLLAAIKARKNFLFREWLWVLPLMAAYVFTIPFSGMLLVSLKFSLVNLVYIVVFYFFLSRVFADHPKLFPQLVLLYGAGMLLVLFWSLFRFWQWEWNPVVVRGIFSPFYKDHTIFGASAALLSAFWFSYAFFNKDRRTKTLAFGAAVLFLGAVLLSTSRGAFLSLLFFGGMLFLFVIGTRLKHLFFLALVFLAAVWLLRQPIQSRLQRIETLSYHSDASLVDRTISTGNVTTDVSNIERLNRWVSAGRMFREKPLTGFGPGTYQFEYIPYQEPALMNRLTVTSPWNIPEGSGGTAHSEYLLALSEMGIVGLLGFLIILGRWFFIAFKKSHDHFNKKWILIAFLALSTYMFHAFFNNFLTTDKFAFLFWGTAAWLISNYHTKNEEEVLPAG